MSLFCIICSDKFQDSQDAVAASCGHIYHLKCITTWLRRRPICPQCRASVRGQKLLKLYLEISSIDFDEEIASLRDACSEKDDKIEFLTQQCKDMTEAYQKGNVCILRRMQLSSERLLQAEKKVETLALSIKNKDIMIEKLDARVKILDQKSLVENETIKQLRKQVMKQKKSIKNLVFAKKRAEELEKENHRLNEHIEKLRADKTFSVSLEDVQKMADIYGREQNIPKLATLCVLLKLEHIKTMKLHSKLRDEHSYCGNKKDLFTSCSPKRQTEIMDNDMPNIKQKEKDSDNLHCALNDLDSDVEILSESGMTDINHHSNVKLIKSESFQYDLEYPAILHPSTNFQGEAGPDVPDPNSSRVKKLDNNEIQLGCSGDHVMTILPFTPNKYKS